MTADFKLSCILESQNTGTCISLSHNNPFIIYRQHCKLRATRAETCHVRTHRAVLVSLQKTVLSFLRSKLHIYRSFHLENMQVQTISDHRATLQ